MSAADALAALEPRTRAALEAAAAQFAADCEQLAVALLEDGVSPTDIIGTMHDVMAAFVPVLVAQLVALDGE